MQATGSPTRRSNANQPIERSYRLIDGSCEPHRQLDGQYSSLDEAIADAIAWIGDLSVTFRQEECRLSRGGVRVVVEGGRIEGAVRMNNYTARVMGLVQEDGAVRSGTVRGIPGADEVEFTGTFGETSASGTWEQRRCRGVWDLRKSR